MNNQYPIEPNEENSYDGPSDDDLKRIEDELSNYID